MSYGASSDPSIASENKPSKVTVPSLRAFKLRGEKIAMMTGYDYTFASLLERSGVDIILVGDSLGMVLQGESSTLGVTLEQMAYHAKAVARASKRALVLVDMPALSYATLDRALHGAQMLLGAGAQMLKLEGAGVMVDIIDQLNARDVPVCGHIGLTPQSLHKLGGFKVQARDTKAAQKLLDDARAIEDAGAEMLVLECVPASIAARVSEALSIPCIGIGAGAHVDGQVLVLHDALGLGTHRRPKFVKNFAEDQNPAKAIERYVSEVKAGLFPSPEYQYE